MGEGSDVPPPRGPEPVPCPGPDPRPWIPHLVVRPGRETRVAVLGQAVLGYRVHWVRDRTEPCLPDCPCRHSPNCRLRPRWEGYLAVLTEYGRVVSILHVPAAAYRCCPQLVALDGQLRGLVLTANRLKESRNAPLRIQVGPRLALDGLPAAPNVAAAMARLWGLPPDADSLDMEGFGVNDWPEVQ